MCGIAGIFSTNSSQEQLLESCRKMTTVLRHRGPDDSGLWTDSGRGLALGHRRLSILDLSVEGRQPMISGCGKYVIVFNGEIYNYREVKEELESTRTNASFRGHSDTEVMLAAISAWGLEKAIEKFVGMFAFGLWDRERSRLSLVRDRLGIKPLYYGWAGKDFLFGSELKAIVAHPGFSITIRRKSLAIYFRHGYIPAPYCIYERAFKVEPGHIVNLSAKDLQDCVYGPLESRPYWSASDVCRAGVSNPWNGTSEEAVEHLEELLRSAVEMRMVSDVPIGALLSGGIDSSTVVALMQSASSAPIKSFTIGFLESDYNEACWASNVARRLGTDHTELYVTDDQAREVIPKLPAIYDEPFADSSQIPTFLLCQLARSKVTVALSGDGGDELFAGYDRYSEAVRWHRLLARYPSRANRIAGIVCRRTPEAIVEAFAVPLRALACKLGYRQDNVVNKVRKFGALASADTFSSLYELVVSHDRAPGYNVVGIPAMGSLPCFETADELESRLGQIQLMSYVDAVSYLPDDLLVKVDRASMAVSLEVRVPILDHRVFEFSTRLPSNIKYLDGKGKWPLKQVLRRYVPDELIDRPKQGFAVPLGTWLRGPLREWMEDFISYDSLVTQGYLNADKVRRIASRHIEGREDNSQYLWSALMFQTWLEERK